MTRSVVIQLSVAGSILLFRAASLHSLLIARDWIVLSTICWIYRTLESRPRHREVATVSLAAMLLVIYVIGRLTFFRQSLGL